MHDMSDCTIGTGLTGRSVKKFAITLLSEHTDILFAKEAVRTLAEQVLTFFFEGQSPR